MSGTGEQGQRIPFYNGIFGVWIDLLIPWSRYMRLVNKPGGRIVFARYGASRSWAG
jgi:hypothetical protein